MSQQSGRSVVVCPNCATEQQFQELHPFCSQCGGPLGDIQVGGEIIPLTRRNIEPEEPQEDAPANNKTHDVWVA